jgi:hypothetical protein
MSVRQYLARLAAIATLGAIAWASACGSPANEGVVVPASSPPTLSASADQAITYPQASDLPEGKAPALAYREYRFPGVWSVSDHDDRLAALSHPVNRSSAQQIYLMSLRDGRRRCVVPRALNAAAGYWIAQCKATSRWIAWEEVSPGDDLISTVTWKLYAAPVRVLRIGRPRLIDAATTSRASRPLFDITGERLVWVVNGARDRSWPSLVYSCDLRGPAVGRAVLRSRAACQSVIARDGLAIVAQSGPLQGADVRLLSVSLTGGRPQPTVDLCNTQDLVQFPAARRGWLAWSLFCNEDLANESLLYVRVPSGIVHLVAENGARRPVFTARYLFYSDDARGAAGAPVTRVCGLDLASMTRFVLQQSETEAEGACLTPLGAPAAEHTLVTQLVRFDQRWSAIRVYRLD